MSGSNPSTADDRLWDAAQELDAFLGGEGAWEWAGARVHLMLASGEAENPAAVNRLADVLERRLARERGAV